MEDERTRDSEAKTPELGASDPNRPAPAESGDGERDVDVLAELAARGNEAVNRVLDELATDPRLTEAIDSLLAVKARLTEATRGALAQRDVGDGESIGELRDRVSGLERRLADLEGSAPSPGAPPSAEPPEDIPS